MKVIVSGHYSEMFHFVLLLHIYIPCMILGAKHITLPGLGWYAQCWLHGLKFGTLVWRGPASLMYHA